uniref:Secreted protein n=1 Tax=Arundo donax TaxID=35708 RepID=A0A0A9C055_ARUDO
MPRPCLMRWLLTMLLQRVSGEKRCDWCLTIVQYDEGTWFTNGTGYPYLQHTARNVQVKPTWNCYGIWSCMCKALWALILIHTPC